LKKVLYIKLLNRRRVIENSIVRLGDVAKIRGNEIDVSQLNEIIIHQIQKNDGSHVMIDILDIVPLIQKIEPDLSIEIVGVTMCILEIIPSKKNENKLFFWFVWILLFVGSSLAIIYFHEDVSMQKVQQRIHYMITGNYSRKPLLFQVPYSLGLGIGMVLFFNHWFKKRLNEEPSPLEVEMFQYQRSLDEFMMINENKRSDEDDLKHHT